LPLSVKPEQVLSAPFHDSVQKGSTRSNHDANIKRLDLARKVVLQPCGTKDRVHPEMVIFLVILRPVSRQDLA
jgi:hypothetical protein